MQTTKERHPRLKRLGWFIGIWAASAAGLALFSYALKAIFWL